MVNVLNCVCFCGQVDREYAVQKALHSAGFPVPQPLLYCSDTDVIGTDFYIMEHVQGRIFRDLRLPGLSAAERVALYVAAVETLARLHSIDVTKLGLQGYGKGAGYSKRQVSTWTKQYRASAHRSIPAMDELSDWLGKNIPSSDNEVTLVHGDFRIDNLIFHPTEVTALELQFGSNWTTARIQREPGQHLLADSSSGKERILGF
uniref:Aminoglycoside phosphotransferase domain-containing protein n=1 Tax=Astyanax mexicanus TaxID=7994 RepID=A0A3B1IX96_ASTMX